MKIRKEGGEKIRLISVRNHTIICIQNEIKLIFFHIRLKQIDVETL